MPAPCSPGCRSICKRSGRGKRQPGQPGAWQASPAASLNCSRFLAAGVRRDPCGHLHLGDHLRAGVAAPAEILALIEQHQLMSRGIGFVDAQLLASARLSHCTLWTQDRRLTELAAALGVSPA